MHSIRKDLEIFQEQLGNGATQRAYKALLSYMMALRTHFRKTYTEYSVSALYQGYMDMTYFAIFPPSLKKRDLKVAIVFNYEAFRFEAWLAGKNREINRRFWKLFKDREWPAYRLLTPATGVDSILEYDLAKGSELVDANTLTATIETSTRAFIEDMEAFLA